MTHDTDDLAWQQHAARLGQLAALAEPELVLKTLDAVDEAEQRLLAAPMPEAEPGVLGYAVAKLHPDGTFQAITGQVTPLPIAREAFKITRDFMIGTGKMTAEEFDHVGRIIRITEVEI